LAQGVWTVPATPVFLAAVERAAASARRGVGEVVLVRVDPEDEQAGATLREAFLQVRLQEWDEFDADCTKYEQEIAKEVRTAKFTLAELEEEEQSLERLRRWYHDLKARDVLGLDAAVKAAGRLRECEAVFEDYADGVYARMHAPQELGDRDA
jgi:hypothetical protein